MISPEPVSYTHLDVYKRQAPASAGPLTISATYKGSAEFSPSTSNSLNETVVAIGTMSALGISPSGGSLAAGEPYTLTASVSPTSGTATCTGNVLFTIGSTTQTVALNASGVATYTITAPAAGGSLTISAAYQGSAEFSPSTSNTMNETVLTISPILPYIEVNGGAWQYVASVTVAYGSTVNLGPVSYTHLDVYKRQASDTITVNPLNGFTGSVNLAAANLPSGISASWGTNPTSGTSVLTISAVANAVVGGQYLVVVTGSSGNQTSQNVLDVTVNPPPGFTLSPSSASVSVTAGSSVTDKITVTPQTGCLLYTSRCV